MALCPPRYQFLPASQAQTYTATRNSAFDYAPNGQLSREVIEPGTANLCVQTAYTYGDAYGNRTASTTSNCAGAAGLARFETRMATVAYVGHSVEPTFLSCPVEKH